MSTDYRPDIDGLRAVAVLPVVMYHAGISLFSGGFVGVDVFFVISGYLITSIILPEIDSGEFRLKHFYERRIRRLFPALFVMILFSVIMAYRLMMPEELEDFGQSVATTIVFASNFMFWSEDGYFEGPAEMKPLLHTWSLAIEEQYYLLFPAVLLLTKKFLAERFMLVILTLLVSSLSISIWSVNKHPDAAFFLLPSRTWELMIGSALAAVTFRPPVNSALRNTLAAIGLLLILTPALMYTAAIPFPGFAALAPCLGTGLLIYVGGNTMIGKLLSWRPIVAIGLISYSLYLWHWPILVFAKHYWLDHLTAGQVALLLGLAFGAAYGSWRFVERPFRGRQGLFTTTDLFRATARAMVILIGIGVVYDETEGLPDRLDNRITALMVIANDKAPNRDRCEGIKPEQVTYDQLCRLDEQAPEVTPTFILWGDSHAMALAGGLAQSAKEQGKQGINAPSNGCVPLLNVTRARESEDWECIEFNDKIWQIIQEHPEIDTVVLSARWAIYSEGSTYKQEGGQSIFLSNKKTAAANLEANQALFRDAFNATVQKIKSSGRQIVIIGSVPEVGRDVPTVLAKSVWHNRPVQIAPSLQEFNQRQTTIHRLMHNFSADVQIEVVALSPLLCDAKNCRVSKAGVPLYFDEDHLARPGIRQIQPALDAIFTD